MLYISNAECRFITTEHVFKKLSARYLLNILSVVYLDRYSPVSVFTDFPTARFDLKFFSHICLAVRETVGWILDRNIQLDCSGWTGFQGKPAIVCKRSTPVVTYPGSMPVALALCSRYFIWLATGSRLAWSGRGGPRHKVLFQLTRRPDNAWSRGSGDIWSSVTLGALCWQRPMANHLRDSPMQNLSFYDPVPECHSPSSYKCFQVIVLDWSIATWSCKLMSENDVGNS